MSVNVESQETGQSRRSGVFISYRRGDTSGQARALRELLVSHLGRERVFMDVDNIALGADFVVQINLAIESSAVLLAVIGKDWVVSDEGVRHFENEADFVRLEIATAFEKNVAVIPILVERAPMPVQADLPPDIWPLLRRHALDLENNHWEYDVGRLLDAVGRLVEAPAVPEAPVVTDARAPTAAPEAQTATSAAAAALPPTPATPVAPPAARSDPPAMPRRRRSLIVAALAVLVIVVVVVVVVAAGSSKSPMVTIGTATAVARASPESLAQALLYSPKLADAPPGVSGVNYVGLLDFRTSGLIEDVEVSYAGPDAYDTVYYLIFDDAADAATSMTAYWKSFKSAVPFAADQPGAPAGTRCVSTQAQTSASTMANSASYCAARTSYAVVVSVTDRYASGATGNIPLTRSLWSRAFGTLGVLATTSAAQGAASKDVPASTVAHLLLGTGANDRENVLPDGAENPGINSPRELNVPLSPAAPGGELAESELSFKGSEIYQNIFYYVFDYSNDASTFYGEPLAPTGAKSVTSFVASGFSEPTKCSTFNADDLGESACYTLAGNVVVESFTASSTDTLAGNNDLTATMARLALFHLYRVIGRRL